MSTTLTANELRAIDADLSNALARFNKQFPGESPARQPIQTLYGGAQIFKADTAAKLGAVALRILEENAPDAATLAKALGWKGPAKLNRQVYSRVIEKLKREPVEDFRIDFEDGYGNRPDAEEDYHAEFTAKETARGMREGTLPPFIGIRTKPLSQELKARAIRTLDVYVSALVKETGGALPDNFIVTLPKPVLAEQVRAMARLLAALERKLSLPNNSLLLELMVEMPQSIIGSDGASNLSHFVEAAEGRCRGAHFGVYDYTASNNITAAYQSMTHPVCDFAREMQRVSLMGTGIWLSDGATNIMPVGPHRAAAGKKLTPKQKKENRDVVHRAWKIMHEHVQHSLYTGYYQGWDLHPAQFPIRYATVYKFFLEGLEAASLRLKTFVEKAAQATLIGDVFDDAATGQGLLNYFLRGINCGAITEAEAQATGLSIEELRGRSFVKILDARRKK
ncbi:MAG: phosphoenolpyruvate kinase [Kiritimatiellae bacterium]|nr:phosphoenolpyruvate kinase [Kiritimatiellia bacterium]MCO5062566.1 phosphoenolpyruvate kinase [Kiritimatiellia bacterium]MCO6399983.1 phosphoenolpyruvate kinase [Verrucomicrobiota bacterium]